MPNFCNFSDICKFFSTGERHVGSEVLSVRLARQSRHVLRSPSGREYNLCETSFPEDVAHLGTGVILYFQYLKTFGAFLAVMSCLAVGMSLICYEAGVGAESDMMFDLSLGNVWIHGRKPDILLGIFDFGIIVICITLFWNLPRTIDEHRKSDIQPPSSTAYIPGSANIDTETIFTCENEELEAEDRQVYEDKLEGTSNNPPSKHAVTVDVSRENRKLELEDRTRPKEQLLRYDERSPEAFRHASSLPSSFTVMIENMEPSTELDSLIKKLWSFGEIVSMCIVLKRSAYVVVDFHGTSDPVSVVEFSAGQTFNDATSKSNLHGPQNLACGFDFEVKDIYYHYWKWHADGVANTMSSVTHRDEEESENEDSPLISQLPNTSITLDNPLMSYVTYQKQSASDLCIWELTARHWWRASYAWVTRHFCFRSAALWASRPKEPSDIQYKNLTVGQYNKGGRRLLSVVVSATLVFLNVFTLFHIQQYRSTHEITKVGGGLLGGFIVLINESLKAALRVLSVWERHDSLSEVEYSIAVSKFAVEVANNIFVVILLFGVPGTATDAQWYKSGGRLVIGILGADAIIPNLIQLFHPFTCTMRFVTFLWVRFTIVFE